MLCKKGETPEECIIREVREETGLILLNAKLRGLITFAFEDKDELAFLYTATEFEGQAFDSCDEGDLVWVSKDKVLELPIWEGDAVFLKLLEEGDEYFSLKLEYQGDKLITWKECRLDKNQGG